MKKLGASWFQTHGGEQSGSTAILDEGMAFKEIAVKLADAEFSVVRREQAREIARAFNVPPALPISCRGERGPILSSRTTTCRTTTF